jgi:hypothetical protein
MNSTYGQKKFSTLPVVVDIVILLKKQKEGQSLDDREQWIIRNSLSSYCLELELIDRVEK